MVEHGFADIGDDALTDPGDEIEADSGENPEERRRNDKGQKIDADPRDHHFVEAAIDHDPERLGNEQADGGGTNKCDERCDDAAPIGPKKGYEIA